MKITLKLKTKTVEYDLRVPKSLISFKKTITSAITKNNVDLLKEAEEQLVKFSGVETVDILIKKIQKHLGNKKLKENRLDNGLIDNIYLFPRCEYYTRFEGTTVFTMDEPKYWGTYHRSESTRYFVEAGGRQKVKFNSPCVETPTRSDSFHAHVGGISTPLSHSDYRDVIQSNCLVNEIKVNVRDNLLHYKCQMAKIIVASFNEDYLISEQGLHRPIVYYQNDYPCVLISLPIFSQTGTEASRYWSEHPKPLQYLLLASFVAFLNVEAMKGSIPIEMVIRASFGQNLPSICETKHSFRINVGLIPTCYAELIGKTLQRFHLTIQQILLDNDPHNTPFDQNFYNTVHQYNANKLKEKINSKPLYAELKNTREYIKAAEFREEFEKLYRAFCKKNKEARKKIKKARFQPVYLEGKTLWEVIRQAGDSMGKSLLSECFRENKSVDWFANTVMEYLLNGYDPKSSIEAALIMLLNYVQYKDKVTMNYGQIEADLKRPKWRFDSLSFAPLYERDACFSQIMDIIFFGFGAKKPEEAIYQELERQGAIFMSNSRGSSIQDLNAEPDNGSDSEFSEDFSDQELLAQNKHFSHRKLRVCSGMKSIVLAHYGALTYLKDNITDASKNKYIKDIDQTYYEVEKALNMVKKTPEFTEINKRNQRIEIAHAILHYDLNHCNASNSPINPTLTDKLDELAPVVVVLDYTSSTAEKIQHSLKECLARNHLDLVLMVESGLKNAQGGMDYNPYGEVRVIARSSEIRDKVFNILKNGLSEEDKLVPKQQEMVRAFKNRGFELSLFGLFKTKKDRFQSIPEREFKFIDNDEETIRLLL